MSLFNLLPQGLAELSAALGASPMGAGPTGMQQAQVPPEHRGLFGLKGTPRDLLGILGDSFLMANGIDPLYYQGREKEKFGDAMAGLGADPEGAIAKASGIDPATGQKLYDNYLDSRDRNAKLKQDAENDAFKNESIFATRIGGILAAANPQTYPAILANARKQAEAKGYSERLSGLPETYDKASVDAWVRGTMEPKDLFNVNYRDARLGQFDRQIGETTRHNQATEGISRTNATTSRGRLDYAKEKRTEVDTFTGDDGYRYTTWSDGTTTRSAAKEKPKATGGGRARPGGAAPAPKAGGPPPPRRVGDRIRGPNGEILTSRDGKTWSK